MTGKLMSDSASAAQLTTIPSTPFTLSLWTDDPERAAAADHAGVDRIGLDLETLGKRERQNGLGTWISTHSFTQLSPIRAALTNATLFVRCNPYNPNSRDEIEQLLDAGVAILMLPNFQQVDDVEAFLQLVDGRAKVVPLLERLAAVHQRDRLLTLQGVSEIHIGINDLALDLALSNRMSVLATELLAELAHDVHAAGIKLGIGGLGRAYDMALPLPADLVYAQYPRLFATGALIARSFFRDNLPHEMLALEVVKMRNRLSEWSVATPKQLEAAFIAFRAKLVELSDHAMTPLLTPS